MFFPSFVAPSGSAIPCDVETLYSANALCNAKAPRGAKTTATREKGLEPPALSFGNLRSTNRTPLPMTMYSPPGGAYAPNGANRHKIHAL